METPDKGFRIFALGGLGEIGMNCLVVESEGRLLLIDCGVMFSSERLGIDLIHPGFDYLAERRDAIEALVLTHAHEDHIAAVPFLLREIDLPIYGAAYTLGLLREKIEEFNLIPKLDARVLNPGGDVAVGPFKITSFPMPHSIVQNAGLYIDTSQGRILHTGDFKLHQLVSGTSDAVLSRVERIAAGGVDLMLADATGSEESDLSGDEADVEQAIGELVQAAPSRVYIAIFSSNIRRLDAILKVARTHGRSVAFCGRSVLTHVRVATQVGALTIPDGLTVSMEEASRMPAGQTLVIVSGTQGEPRSALGRLADDNHHVFRIEKDDLVILSSRFIPGNELAIGQVIDRLHRLGARVIHRSVNSRVHVSGHASRKEIARMISTVSPRCLIPVHGTYRHLIACAQLARDAGVKEVLVASDGQMVQCDKRGLSLLESRVQVHRVFIDGDGGLTEGEIRDRRILGSHGVLIVSLCKDASGGVLGQIEVIARGVAKEQAIPWLAEQVRGKVEAVLADMAPAERTDLTRCRDLIRSALRRFVSKMISREPYVLVSLKHMTKDNQGQPRDDG
ncbi:MAG: ribonuclease J [Myxococcota bacterium]|nr:ribonuclease J [Myxococcota bacterium]